MRKPLALRGGAYAEPPESENDVKYNPNHVNSLVVKLRISLFFCELIFIKLSPAGLHNMATLMFRFLLFSESLFIIYFRFDSFGVNHAKCFFHL